VAANLKRDQYDRSALHACHVISHVRLHMLLSHDPRTKMKVDIVSAEVVYQHQPTCAASTHFARMPATAACT